MGRKKGEGEGGEGGKEEVGSRREGGRVCEWVQHSICASLLV